MLELNRVYTERTYTRGFCLSDDLCHTVSNSRIPLRDTRTEILFWKMIALC